MLLVWLVGGLERALESEQQLVLVLVPVLVSILALVRGREWIYAILER